MRYRLAGPLEVIVAAGQGVELVGERERLLPAALLSDANRVVSPSRLIEALRGEHSPSRRATRGRSGA